MFYESTWQSDPDQLLTILVTAIGLGALTVSALGVLLPNFSPNVYGLPSVQSYTGRREQGRRPDVSLHATNQRILLHSLTIRNIVIGVFVLVLNSYWQKNISENPEKAAAIRTCLGIFILTGTTVPIVDCIGAWTAASGQQVNGVAIKAAAVHASRAVFWLSGGIWCLAG